MLYFALQINIVTSLMCHFAALPYLDDDGESTFHMLFLQYFYFKISFIGEQDKESPTP